MKLGDITVGMIWAFIALGCTIYITVLGFKGDLPPYIVGIGWLFVSLRQLANLTRYTIEAKEEADERKIITN